MKTQIKPVALSVATNTIMAKRSLVSSALLVGSIALTGCQSMSTNPSSVTNVAASQNAAKTSLESALKKQRRSSFSYHSNIEISNEQQFTNVDQTQLVAAETAARYCEETHDQAYADLIAQAQVQNLELSAPQYKVQRSALKNKYLACRDADQAWQAKRADDYYDSYDDYDSDENEAIVEVSEPLVIEAEGQEGATILETSTIKGNPLNEKQN